MKLVKNKLAEMGWLHASWCPIPEVNLNNIDDGYGGSDVRMYCTDRHLCTTFRLLVVEHSSIVSVLFREKFSHPYISFFHLPVNFFCYYNIKLSK